MYFLWNLLQERYKLSLCLIRRGGGESKNLSQSQKSEKSPSLCPFSLAAVREGGGNMRDREEENFHLSLLLWQNFPHFKQRGEEGEERKGVQWSNFCSGWHDRSEGVGWIGLGWEISWHQDIFFPWEGGEGSWCMCVYVWREKRGRIHRRFYSI